MKRLPLSRKPGDTPGPLRTLCALLATFAALFAIGVCIHGLVFDVPGALVAGAVVLIVSLGAVVVLLNPGPSGDG